MVRGPFYYPSKGACIYCPKILLGNGNNLEGVQDYRLSLDPESRIGAAGLCGELIPHRNGGLDNLDLLTDSATHTPERNSARAASRHKASESWHGTVGCPKDVQIPSFSLAFTMPEL